VWEVLTEPRHISTWAEPGAEVEPGEGGRYKAVTPEGARIRVWKPCEQLGLGVSDVAAIEDFYLEARGGKTLLRIVCTGWPDDATWDRAFRATRDGWNGFLHMLRFYVERHFGKERAGFSHPARGGGDVVADLGRLLGAVGLEPGWDRLEPGDTFVLRSPGGERLSGSVWRVTRWPEDGPGPSDPPDPCKPEHRNWPVGVIGVGLDVSEYEHGLLGLGVYRLESATVATVGLSTFGLAEARSSALAARWRAWIAATFPPRAG